MGHHIDEQVLVRTRLSLHGAAELLLAGPQLRESDNIELHVSPGGFATVAAPDVRVDGADLVAGDQRVPLSGHTFAEIAAKVGIEPRTMDDVYAEGSGQTPQDSPDVEATAAAVIASAFAAGDEALRRFAPTERPILWPEHFDVAITVDEVNYGLSPGDAYSPVPYAYVGPWTARIGDFWNAPFGAARPFDELGDAGAIVTFFEEGRRLASRG